MSRYGKGSLRLFGALVLVAALQPFSSFMQADDAGRNFSRCVQNCNDAKMACDRLCLGDCKEMFPEGTQRDACVNACKEICAAESEDCKQVCLDNKTDHQEEP